MELIGRIKAGLSDREMQGLKVRFGVDFSGGTNEEILAAMLEITQEKIQKIERKALKRLKGKGWVMTPNRRCRATTDEHR